MSGKAFFIDTTRCTACRGCQVACKQWNRNPATETRNRGSYQNPEDLNFSTYKLVRFQEHKGKDGKPVWYFFPDQCRHCVEPPCKEMGDSVAPRGIVIDRHTGAVLYTDFLRKADPEEIRNSCPFDIPRAQEGTGLITKCTMCVDRVHNGLLPACVKVCPTGTMNFGDRTAMAELARKRLDEVKQDHPRARVTGMDDLRVFFLLTDEPDRYHLFAAVDAARPGLDRKAALRRIARSLGDLSREVRLLRSMSG
jgi:formate dehydrogenase iron-sulfur subunit